MVRPPGGRWCHRICIALSLAAANVVAEPLPVRDSSPFGAPLAPDAAWGGRLLAAGHWLVETNVALANYLSRSSDAADAVNLDGESRRFRWRARRGLGDRYEITAEVPWVMHGGGLLDGFIDAYHDAFGFPDGGRDAVADGNLDVRLVDDGRPRTTLSGRARGLGDISLGGALALHAVPQGQLALRASLRLPVGDAGDLTGSGGVALGVAAEFSSDGPGGLPLGLDARLGVMMHAGTDLAPSDAPAIGFGTLALYWRATPRLDLVAQFDAHSAAYRNGLRETGEWAAIGTLGGRLRLWKNLYWSLSLSEDLRTDVTPDVVIQSGLGWRGAVTGR